MRIYGILADYPDQNDHTVLKSDPIFKLLCNRSLDDSELASQATLSRFENAIDIPSLNKLRDVLIDQFIASFEQPPSQLTLDIDTFDDPTHGELSGDERRAYWNHRREQDPLGRGQPDTWRTRLFKVAALVRQTQRRVVIELSSTWPFLNHYQQLSQQILCLSNQTTDSSQKLDSS